MALSRTSVWRQSSAAGIAEIVVDVSGPPFPAQRAKDENALVVQGRGVIIRGVESEPELIKSGPLAV